MKELELLEKEKLNEINRKYNENKIKIENEKIEKLEKIKLENIKRQNEEKKRHEIYMKNEEQKKMN